MCGLPATLSYDEQVQLHLNLERVRWRKIDDMVQAIRIANGQQAPAGYYQAILDDPEAAVTTMGNDLLGRMMRGR